MRDALASAFEDIDPVETPPDDFSDELMNPDTSEREVDEGGKELLAAVESLIATTEHLLTSNQASTGSALMLTTALESLQDRYGVVLMHTSMEASASVEAYHQATLESLEGLKNKLLDRVVKNFKELVYGLRGRAGKARQATGELQGLKRKFESLQRTLNDKPVVLNHGGLARFLTTEHGPVKDIPKQIRHDFEICGYFTEEFCGLYQKYLSAVGRVIPGKLYTVTDVDQMFEKLAELDVPTEQIKRDYTGGKDMFWASGFHLTEVRARSKSALGKMAEYHKVTFQRGNTLTNDSTVKTAGAAGAAIGFVIGGANLGAAALAGAIAAGIANKAKGLLTKEPFSVDQIHDAIDLCLGEMDRATVAIQNLEGIQRELTGIEKKLTRINWGTGLPKSELARVEAVYGLFCEHAENLCRTVEDALDHVLAITGSIMTILNKLESRYKNHEPAANSEY